MKCNLNENKSIGYENILAAYQKSLDSKSISEVYDISKCSLDRFLNFIQYSSEHNFKKSSMVMVPVNHDPSKMVIYMSQLLLERGLMEVSFVNMASLSEEDLHDILDISDMDRAKEKVIYYFNKDYSKRLSTYRNKKYERSALEVFETLRLLLHSHTVNVKVKDKIIKTILEDMSCELGVSFTTIEKDIILNSLNGECSNLPQIVFDMLQLKCKATLPSNIGELTLLMEKAAKLDEVMEIMGRSILR